MNTLITGGAGFIGINASKYFAEEGHKVTILDNFFRRGGKSNVDWLKKQGVKIRIIEADVRDFNAIKKAVAGNDLILHLAGQVAVTSSVKEPRDDFESNLLGTFNILEASRQLTQKPIVFYSSTNKVYGGLEDLKIKELRTRYAFTDLPNGVSEKRPLDFHSPYGCSKGGADQYVRDYARIYGLRTVVFRQSCIYGPRQFGLEDQGWIAWFIIALTQNKKITIYGNGKQVRDVLYIDDLMDAYNLALKKIEKSKGEIYNIGGGINNSLSIWFEFKPLLEDLFKRNLEVNFDSTRPGDQPIYISDIEKARKELGWRPKIGHEKGIKRLFDWIQSNSSLFTS